MGQEHTVTAGHSSCYAARMFCARARGLFVLALASLAFVSSSALTGCGDKKPGSIIPKDDAQKLQEERCDDAKAACKQVKERIQLVRGCSSDSHCIVVPDTTRCGCFGGCAQVANIGGADTAVEMMRQAASACDVSGCTQPKAVCKEPLPKCVEGKCVDANLPAEPTSPIVPVPAPAE